MKETVNPLIAEQLEKCMVTDISHLTKDYIIMIPKITTIKLEINGSYLVKIDDSARVPSMFNTNWNKGLPPISEYMQVEVTNMMSQFVRFNGLEYNPETKQAGPHVWNGWVPVQSLTILERI